MISSNQIYKDKQYCTLCGNSGKVIESVYGFKTEIVDCYKCVDKELYTKRDYE